MPPRNQNKTIPYSASAEPKVVAIQWPKIFLTGALLPVLVAFFAVGAVVISFSLVGSVVALSGVLIAVKLLGPVAQLLGIVIQATPFLVFAMGGAFILAKLYRRWDIPGAYNTAFISILVAFAIDVGVTVLSDELHFEKSVSLPILLVSLGGLVCVPFCVWTSYLPMGRLKQILKLIIAALSTIVTGICIKILFTRQ